MTVASIRTGDFVAGQAARRSTATEVAVSSHDVDLPAVLAVALAVPMPPDVAELLWPPPPAPAVGLAAPYRELTQGPMAVVAASSVVGARTPVSVGSLASTSPSAAAGATAATAAVRSAASNRGRQR